MIYIEPGHRLALNNKTCKIEFAVWIRHVYSLEKTQFRYTFLTIIDNTPLVVRKSKVTNYRSIDIVNHIAARHIKSVILLLD